MPKKVIANHKELNCVLLKTKSTQGMFLAWEKKNSYTTFSKREGNAKRHRKAGTLTKILKAKTSLKNYGRF